MFLRSIFSARLRISILILISPTLDSPTAASDSFSRPRIRITTPADAELVLAEAAANGESAMRTVEIDGQTRVVGVASLGGRRQAMPADIAAINQRLAAFEAPASPPAEPIRVEPPAGVTVMDVEEVGRPTR